MRPTVTHLPDRTMRALHRRAGALLLLFASLPVAAQPASALEDLDKGMTGPRTAMLTLGSIHLRELDTFDPAALEPLLERLAAFAPGVITIEAHGGAECDFAARHPTLYDPDYCASTEAARDATGLEIPQALAEIERMLGDWPATPVAADRRRLASRFLAANDPASALVQWLRLDPVERRVGDGLDPALVALLERVAVRDNESYRIGSRLAARLGLERVHPVDDHTGDRHRLADRKAFGQALSAAWSSDGGRLDAVIAEQRRLAAADDLLPLYRMLNSLDHVALLADSNVGVTLRAPGGASHYPQIWVNGWELRNLRMVGNILEAVRDRPGQRVLNIVGASHKPWFDAWLGQMSGVDIVDAQQVLE